MTDLIGWPYRIGMTLLVLFAGYGLGSMLIDIGMGKYG